MKIKLFVSASLIAISAIISGCGGGSDEDIDYPQAIAAFVEHPTYCQALIGGRGGIRMDEYSDTKPQDAEATAAFLAILEAPNLSIPQRNSVSPTLVGKCRQKISPIDYQQAIAAFVEHPTYCQALIDGRGGIRMDEYSYSKPQDAEATAAFFAILDAPNLSMPQRNSVSPMLVGTCRQKISQS